MLHNRKPSRARRLLPVLGVVALAPIAWILLRPPSVVRDCEVARDGLWQVCQKGQSLTFAIPREILDKELLLVERPGGASASEPLGNHLFRWTLRDGRLVAQRRKPQRFASADGRLLDDTKVESPWQDAASLRVESGRWFGQVEVDATALFRGPHTLTGRTVDAGNAVFKRVMSFPRNVVLQMEVQNRSGAKDAGNATTEWNFVVLPERPMAPRRADPRMPAFPLNLHERIHDEDKLRDDLVTRWRLEKKHPDQEVSEPVQPIVFHIDPSTPEQWKPYLRKAIEVWNSAFENAGFRNAVVAREAPADDPEFGFDARHTVLVWDNQDWVRQVIDPRTGEILHGAAIASAYEVINRGKAGYELFGARQFIRMAGIDASVDRYPLTPEMEARTVQFVATHEMGHNLGLRDGNYGENAYTIEQVRDPAWVRQHGFTPSILNYSRFNYVAEPDDGMDIDLLTQQLGPADRAWMKVMYTVFPGADSVWKEAEPMNALLTELQSRPELRFNPGFVRESGPDTANENIEVVESLEAARRGVANLKRALARVPQALERGGGIGRGNVYHLHAAAMAEWYQMMKQASVLVGGYTFTGRGGADPGPVRRMVPAALQRDAMRFLVQEAFVPPKFLRAAEISALLQGGWPWETEDDLDALLAAQRTVLRDLIGKGHNNPAIGVLERLAAAEVDSDYYLYPDNERYTLTQFLTDLRAGIWSELRAGGAVHIDPYRQGLQEAHIQQLKETLTITQPDVSAGHIYEWLKPYPRSLHPFILNAVSSDLHALAQQIDAAQARARDPVVRAHLRRMRSLIGPV